MVKAIHDNVVLEKKTNQVTKGIYMPFSFKDECFIVLNVGPEVSTVKAGMLVILKEKPLSFNDGTKEIYITNIENVIAIVEEENE